MWGTTNRIWGAVLFTAAFFILGAPQIGSAALIAPEAADIPAKPGEEVVHPFAVGNDTGRVQTYSVELIGLAVGESRDELRFEPLPEQLTGWVLLTHDTITVEAHSTEEIAVVVRPPEGIDPGVYTFGLRVIALAEEKEGLNVQTGFIVPVFMTIGQNLRAAGELLAFSAEKKFYSSPPVRLFVTTRNSGEQVNKPSGRVVFRDLFGKELARRAVSDGTSRVLPGMDRALLLVWGTDGDETFFKRLSREASMPIFGPVTAELTFTPYEEGGIIVEKARMFFFPWRFVFSSAFILAIISGVFLLLYKKQRA